MLIVGDSKREREWSALRCVYDEKTFESVIPNEKPDFVLTHRGNQSFGVEITEFFQSEPDARAYCISDYVPSLLTGGQPRHKDDYVELAVSTASIQDADGIVKTDRIPVIMRAQPTVDQYRRMLIEVIRNKYSKVDGYDESLSHINLIVRDHVSLLWCNEREDFSKFVFNDDLRKLVSESKFREIFLVTFLDRSEVYIPLGMLCLMSEFQLFGATVERMGQAEVDEDLDLFRFFAHFLRSRGYPANMTHDGGEEVFFGNTGLMVDENKGVILRDYADLPLPSVSELPPLPSAAKELLDTVLRTYEQVTQEVVFVTSLARNVLSPESAGDALST